LDFGDNGFRVMVSQRIPEVVRDLIPDVIHAFGDLVHLEKLNSFILHPGGAKILRVFEDVLQRPAATFAESYEVLAPFVLDSKVWLRSASEQGYCLLAAFGPGFTAEASLLRWASR
jgi:alkylresorcinol/alkylpyrone synthase